jgi:hypothetical protein
MRILLSLLAAVLLISAWIAVNNEYDTESLRNRVRFGPGALGGKASVQTELSVVAFTPARGDLVIRIEQSPEGGLEKWGVLAEPLEVITNGAAGRVQTIYKKGESMAPFEVTIATRDGDPGDYPDDAYQATFTLVAGRPAAAGGVEPLPTFGALDTRLDGFTVKAEPVPSESGVLNIRLELRRTPSVWFFARFVLGLMLAIAVAAGLVVSTFVRDPERRPPELPLFQWLATLLFALVPLRNAMPGAPAIGARCDYLSFFWAEASVALAMITLVALWLLRRPR